MKRHAAVILFAAIVLSLTWRSACAAQIYQVTDLGTLPTGTNLFSTGYGINDSGQVTGNSGFHAFLYSGGAMSDLGSLDGANAERQGNSVNASGQVAGWAQIANGSTQAFLYSNGVMTDLGTLPGGGQYFSTGYGGSNGLGINASGQVTGTSSNSSGVLQAFLYSNGVMTDLGTLPGGGVSFGESINASGQVAGFAYDSTSAERAFFYSGGVMTSLGTLGGSSSGAYAINDGGQIAGVSQNQSGFNNAFLDSSGVMTNLGALPGLPNNAAYGINDSGQVVGYSYNYLNGPSDAFLYSDGAMTDLNSLIDPSSGWVLSEAKAINNFGQITGYGEIDGDQHAFLLAPIVPEPDSVALAAMATAGLFGFAR